MAPERTRSLSLCCYVDILMVIIDRGAIMEKELPKRNLSVPECFFSRCDDQKMLDYFEPRHGSGRTAELLVEFVVPAGKLIACDFSDRMIEKCRRRNLPGQVVIRKAPVHDLPLEGAG